ncbi:hypothetical protein SDC9_190049 [bioreactor metagenome]|uniref:Uncharacterized protein n=1 Tax=bioreactor metagenome TaxID=1076179 RepID=A0A645HVJ9_9ZZZZ
MDNALCRGTNLPISIHVGHDIVAVFLFLFAHDLVIDFVHFAPKRIHLLLCNGQAHLHLRFSERCP